MQKAWPTNVDHQRTRSYKFAKETLQDMVDTLLVPKSYEGTIKLFRQCIDCMDYMIKEIEDTPNEKANEASCIQRQGRSRG